MANFNKIKNNSPSDFSYEGGAVYEKSKINEWLNFLFSSFLEERFYESAEYQQKRFLQLTDDIANIYGYSFVARAAIFTRNKLGMRSVSQLIAAWLNDKSFENKRAFYKAFMHRPDDVAEIFAAIDYLGTKRSHAFVRGAADYLSNLDAYSLGKYKLNSHTYNMYDLINLTHANSQVINAYKQNELETPDTWEVAISTASAEMRSTEWKRLVEQQKLGYMALIRNLNNILNSGVTKDWIKKYLVPQLTNENAIKKSLVFPYRIYNAYKNLNIVNFIVNAALDQAFTISIQNMPILEGENAILLDVSGSMNDKISTKSCMSIKEVGACFAVAIYIANPQTKIIKFGNRAKEISFNLADSPFNMIDQLCNNDNCGYGTQITPAFDLLAKTSFNMKRIFIISDMQVMDRGYYYEPAVNVYHKLFNKIPAYSFDLGNYHTQILSKYDHLHYLTTLNERVFEFISLLEANIDLVDYINSFNYC